MNFFTKTDQLITDKREIEKKMKGLNKKTKEYKDLENEMKANTKKWNELVNAR